MPTFAGVTPNTPVGAVKRRSQQAAISTPPPMQWPRIIAIVGFGKSRRAACAARLSRRTTAIGVARPAEQVSDVGSGAEAGPGAGDQQHADGGVVGQLREDAG